MQLKTQLIQLTSKLITYKSTPESEKGVKDCLSFISHYFGKNSFTVKHFKSNSVQSILITKKGSKNRAFDIIFHGHIDVIPARNDEFKPIVKGNRIYGRGAADMKGGLAVLMYAFKNIQTSKNVALLITSDEERGGINGTRYVLNGLDTSCDLFITAEGEREWMIKTEQKGVCMIRIKAKGLGEHSSYTWKGHNAIESLMETFREIQTLFPKKNDPHNWYSTVNIGTIKGGHAVNAVPEYAEADIDIRFCEPWKTPEDVINAINKITKKHKNIVTEVILTASHMRGGNDKPSIMHLNTVAKSILKKNSDLYVKNHGTNDARFASELGYPAVAFGPIGKNYHAEGEYVEIESLVKYLQIIQKIL